MKWSMQGSVQELKMYSLDEMGQFKAYDDCSLCYHNASAVYGGSDGLIRCRDYLEQQCSGRREKLLLMLFECLSTQVHDHVEVEWMS